MDKNISDNFSKFASNMMESMKELQSINEKTMQTLTEQQFAAAKDFIKTGTEQLEQLGKAKTVEEAVSEQAKITSSISQMILDNAQATMKTLTSGQKDLEALINKAVEENKV